MKKLMLIITALLMCLVMAACGAADTSADTADEDSGDNAVEAEYKALAIENGTDMGTFETVDLEGNEVTDAIFADKDVTIVNVWATFCGPCMEEMPDLAKLSGDLPENAQIVGVVIDAPPSESEIIDDARKICEENGVTYKNLIASDSIMQMFSSVEAVPTTFILDSEGKTVCKAILGADVRRYRSEALSYLKKK